jgi:hypothetical protein
MKIDSLTLYELRRLLDPLDTDRRRNVYRNGDFYRADKVKDLNKRYRWDLFLAANGYSVLPEGVNDSHIDTALRRLVPTL